MLAWWLSSEIIHTHLHVPCILTWLLFDGGVYFTQSFRLCGYYWTIQGQRLFTEIYLAYVFQNVYCNAIAASHVQTMCHIFIQWAGELELCHTARGTAVVCDIQERQLERKHLYTVTVYYIRGLLNSCVDSMVGLQNVPQLFFLAVCGTWTLKTVWCVFVSIWGC